MPLLDDGQLLFVLLLKRGLDELLEVVRDLGDGGVHDEHGRAAGAALLHDGRDVLPVGEAIETLVPPNLRTIHGECARVTR